jgi:hypothetical protein
MGACAAFIKESRMKFVNARDLYRKPGCTLERTWGTRPEPTTIVGDQIPPVPADLIWTSLKFSRPYGTFQGHTQTQNAASGLKSASPRSASSGQALLDLVLLGVAR